MQTKSILRTAWESVTSPGIGKLPLLTGYEQTKLSWARVIESYDQLPEAFKDFFKTLMGDTSVFPYAVRTPTFKGFIKQENEKLIFSLNGKIYVLERARDKLTSTCYSLDGISYVEVGTILLNSWIKISGVASNGILTSSSLRFSAVTDYLFTPILEKIRPAISAPGDTDQNSERAKFDYLMHLNFKFMNYARRSLVPGEKVVYTVLQPEIRASVLTLLGRSLSRTISTAHLGILTDRELIMIREEKSGRWDDKTRYGGIWNYIPLDKITSLSLVPKNDNLLVLSIHLPQNDHIESLFSVSNKQEVELFLSRLGTLIPGVTIKNETAAFTTYMDRMK
jgi:hypothetical protein